MKNKYSVVCPQCGTVNPLSQRKCINCGTPLPLTDKNFTITSHRRPPQHSRLLGGIMILVVVIAIIVMIDHNDTETHNTTSYNLHEIILLDRHHRVIKQIYYTNKNRLVKDEVIYGKLVQIPAHEIKRFSSPDKLRKAYQQARYHYPYRLDIEHSRGVVEIKGHHVIFANFRIENGKWIKEEKIEPVYGYPDSRVKYYRFRVLDNL